MKSIIFCLVFAFTSAQCGDEYAGLDSINFQTVQQHCCSQLEQKIIHYDNQNIVYEHSILRQQALISRYQKQIASHTQNIKQSHKRMAFNKEHMLELARYLQAKKSIQAPSFSQEYPPLDRLSITYQNFIANHWDAFHLGLFRQFIEHAVAQQPKAES